MTNTLKYLGLILIFFFIGFIIRDLFFDFSHSQIANKTISIGSRTVSGQFYSHILFTLSIGILPLLYLIIKKITKITFLNKGLISFGIIVVCGISLWLFRIFQLKNRFQNISDFYNGSEIKTEPNFSTMSLNSMNFGLYLFIGFLIGTVLSILIYRNQYKTATE
ncbi:hypothetical protein H7F37_03925 [Winogradskyella sp. PAMC22761]|nr:hypothetical protein H7F37_03885 [Winogradskyella sp. PAMC22761]QNK78240.1 hypothetical protein H7F37_03925 [Winogradskyella sp. PAMC22761]